MSTRRDFLSLALQFSLAPLGAFASQEPSIRATSQDKQQSKTEPMLPSEEWMKQWMVQRGEVGTLVLSRFVEPIYFLMKPITWTPNPDEPHFSPVTAPPGFVTDLASIPRPFWSMLRPDGEYVYPAILHDYMYWTQSRPRKEADSIFRLGMQDFDIDKATVAIIYTAVRERGGRSWTNNAALKKAGERRILSHFPDNPHVRWAEWKKDPNVFLAE